MASEIAMEKQVDADHYEFSRYMRLPRWNSIWYQMQELSSLPGNTVLEIGPGAGYLKDLSKFFGKSIETVDLDPDLRPDHVASVTALPFADASYDIVCAFQVLEHLPFEDAINALGEIARVSKSHVVISLPDSRRVWRYMLHVPRLGAVNLMVPRPQVRAPKHYFDGEHHWEINKARISLSTVLKAFERVKKLKLEKTFRPPENTYHRFFVFSVL